MKKLLLIVCFLFAIIFLAEEIVLAGEIHDAVKKADESRIRALVKTNPEAVNEYDNDAGFYPLHHAVFKGNIVIVKLLLELGADVNSKAKEDVTPLHMAAYSGRDRIIKLLIEKGADVNASAKNGFTPMNMALETGRKKTAELLEQYGGKAMTFTREEKDKNKLYAEFENITMKVKECLACARYSEGLIHAEKAVEIGRKMPESMKSYLAASLGNLGVIHYRLGNLEKAEKLLKEALIIEEKSKDRSTEMIRATIRSKLGLVCYSMGQIKKGEALLIDANKVLEKQTSQLGKEFLAENLNNLSALYRDIGDFRKAEKTNLRSMELSKEFFGKNHYLTLTSLNNLAHLYSTVHRYDKALEIYTDLIKTIESGKSDVRNIHLLSKVYHNLAAVYEEKEQYETSLKLYIKALKLKSVIFKKDCSDIAKSYICIGRVLGRSGHLDKAKEALVMAETILEKDASSKQDLALCLNHLGTLSMLRKKYDDAEKYLNESLRIENEVYGSDNPHTATNLATFSILYIARNENQKAYETLSRVLSIDDMTLDNIFSISSESQRLEALGKFEQHYTGFLSFIIDRLKGNETALTGAYNVVLKRKGIVLDSMSRDMGRTAAMKDPKLSEMLIEYRTVVSRIARAGLSEDANNPDLLNIRYLQTRKNDLEKQLAASGYERNKTIKIGKKATFNKLINTIPPGSILVDYIKIPKYNFLQGGKKSSEYYAFVIKKDWNSPKLIEIGDSNVIDKTILMYLSHIERVGNNYSSGILDEKTAEKQSAQISNKLYNLVIKPVLDKSGQISRIYTAPDGELNFIPFEALVNEKGKYLLEEYDIQYVNSGSHLIESLSANATDKDGRIVVFAGPDFDLDPSQQKKISSQLVKNRSFKKQNEYYANRGQFNEKFCLLPGTIEEAASIDKIYGPDKVEKYIGENALEEVFKNLTNPWRLHVATHGFYTNVKRRMVSGNQLMGSYEVLLDNPMLCSGVVLSGANANNNIENNDNEDGILTAYEISGIPMSGTDLVFLSACDTGKGQTRSGEGIFGLRRAFQLAGAKTVIMTTWSIPDRETCELIIMFYNNLHGGCKKGEALRRAKLEIIRLRRENNQSAHPFFWASFVAVGEQ